MGVGPRLTTFFSSSRGVKLLETFKTNGLDPEVIPFLLTSFVWPVQRLKAAPSRRTVHEVAKHLRKAARSLAELEHQDCGVTGTANLREMLIWWADRLTKTVLPVGHVGNIALGSKRELKTKKDVAKRTVVFFLLGYLRDGGKMKSGIWPIITEVLVAVGLAKPDARHENIASWWWASVKRANKINRPINEHQKGLLLLFSQVKDSVHAFPN